MSTKFLLNSNCYKIDKVRVDTSKFKFKHTYSVSNLIDYYIRYTTFWPLLIPLTISWNKNMSLLKRYYNIFNNIFPKLILTIIMGGTIFLQKSNFIFLHTNYFSWKNKNMYFSSTNKILFFLQVFILPIYILYKYF